MRITWPRKRLFHSESGGKEWQHYSPHDSYVLILLGHFSDFDTKNSLGTQKAYWPLFFKPVNEEILIAFRIVNVFIRVEFICPMIIFIIDIADFELFF